jgi:hypothetical protein
MNTHALSTGKWEMVYTKTDSPREAVMVMEQLQKWLDIPYLIWTRDVQILGQELTAEKERVSLRIYTENNRYRITAEKHVGEDKSYLGCIASSRKPRAGEEYTRGNDLPDGKFNKGTFDSILAAIVGYEVVKVHLPDAKQIATADPVCNLEIAMKSDQVSASSEK